MQRLIYTAIAEKAPSNYSAYLPDVPGCVATGRTAEEALKNLRQSLAFHLEGLKEDGIDPPPPLSIARQIEPDAAVA